MSRVQRVDVNCDMGEGADDAAFAIDDAILPYVSSASIACGLHAGGPSVMRRTVRAAARHGVAVGAHPGLPDRAGFGRRAMHLEHDEIHDLVTWQVGTLLGLARSEGVTLRHVKPHGALYNTAAADAAVAHAVARAVRDIDPSLILFGLSGSALIHEARRLGLCTASEVFADRGYESDGSLTPRTESGALIGDPQLAARRALRMVLEGTVATRDGSIAAVSAETICVHGDGPYALEIARALRAALDDAGVSVLPPDP